MSEIAQALDRLYRHHRIVFWYDVKRELRAEFDALDLPDVTKIVLDNNQFGVKVRILRQEADRRFLLYHSGPPPADLENWLLDVQLAQGEFRADQTSLWLTELGLGFEFAEHVQPHAEFLRAAERREALRTMLSPDDTPSRLKLKMAAVCAAAEPRLEDILEHLLAELAAGRDERFRLLQRCGLDVYLWQQVERDYAYRSDSPGMRDFAISLFKAGYAMGLGEAAEMSGDALVFLKRWKDSVRHHDAFETLSADCANILNIEADLEQRELSALAQLDIFELIDRKILSELAARVANRTILVNDCEKLIRGRRRSHWYDRYLHPYEAISRAAELLALLDRVDLSMRSLADGIRQYASVWYRLDQLYRQFIYHRRQSGQTTLLGALADLVENLYTTRYLLALNDRWQEQVDRADRWEAPPILSQQAFYERKVDAFLRRDNKVVVIISDGLRYEVGEELLHRIRQEDRFEATIEPALTLLPSYTQLGMAALLPHETLEIKTGEATVLVNGISSQGVAQRGRILEQALPGRASAVRAEEVLAMSRDEYRALFRDHDVVYIYHNQIDAIGDKRESEERVFEAAEATLDELIRLIKRLVNANASNLLVTADHGFIYQHRPLDESDFVCQEASGTEIWATNRRFALGRGLEESSSFKHFTGAQMGLQGECEIVIPKSINRLRLRGAGSRYVHGGAALQEVVIPVLQINKKRQSDVSQVEVDILRRTSHVITAGQLSVAFYQTEAVTAKLQPRTLTAGIYTQAGDLISNEHELRFDSSSDNPRDRETPVRFVLTQRADEANGQEVVLRLRERVTGTSHLTEYRSERYLLRRAFTSDFDF